MNKACLGVFSRAEIVTVKLSYRPDRTEFGREARLHRLESCELMSLCIHFLWSHYPTSPPYQWVQSKMSTSKQDFVFEIKTLSSDRVELRPFDVSLTFLKAKLRG